jgi:hypothetical protein
MEKEVKFMKRVLMYIKEHGLDDFYDPIPPKAKGVLPSTIVLPKTTLTSEDLEEYKENVKKSLHKHRRLYEMFKDTPNVESLIYRYDKMGFLGNISLSVHPSIKEEWKITHELFGAFYNSDYPHCSLFPDLEDSLGNALKFKPKKGMIILVNPPYTYEWIKWTCNFLIENKNKAQFACVLPIWDRKSRNELRLSRQPDFPEIQELITHSESHEMVHLGFYDGISGKRIKLKDKVHVIKL